MFTVQQGAKLVALVRHAIETILFNKPMALDQFKEFSQKTGVYVTLKKNGKLRGQMVQTVVQSYAAERIGSLQLVGKTVKILRQHDIF